MLSTSRRVGVAYFLMSIILTVPQTPAATAEHPAAPYFQTQDVFVAHESAADAFVAPQDAGMGANRIAPTTKPAGIYYLSPGIVVTAHGSVLAYTECRDSCPDWGDIHVNLRRSTDGGITWGPEHKIAHVGETVQAIVRSSPPKPKGQELAITVNNPTAIADRDGTVHFLYCIEYRRVFYMKSNDDGLTFSRPVEISNVFEKFRPQCDWKIVATGPGHGIQLKNGRLVVPVWLATGSKSGFEHRPSITAVIYSDDHGQTWQAGDIVARGTGRGLSGFHDPNETCSIQLADGSVLFNIRAPSATQRRLASISPNGVTDWSQPQFMMDLPEPLCFGGMARLSESGPSDKNRILFSHCNGLNADHGGAVDEKWCRREDLSVYMSYDEGKTWPVRKVIEPGFAGPGYSDMTVLPDGTMMCLYCEPKSKQGRGSSLAAARFNLEWLTDGKDSLSATQSMSGTERN